MNPTPPFQGRGFGFGPQFVRFHDSVGNTPLQWATFALVLLLVLTVGALLVARFAGGPPRRRQFRLRGRPDPLEVLRIRFASGQITRDEFLQATTDLTGPIEPAA